MSEPIAIAPKALAERATITVEEAAQIIGIGRNQAYNAAATGQLPTLRIGRRILVPTAKLFDMLGGQDHRLAGLLDGPS